jgi:hypothetical protein
MTRTTNARIAGFTFLFYIAAGIAGMVLSGRAAGTGAIAAKLASIAQHASDVRIAIMFGMLTSVAALVLAVTLYGLTRDQDSDLAMLALSFRVGEGVVGTVGTLAMLGLLWLATEGTGTGVADAPSADALGAFMLKTGGWATLISADFFAVGSTLFSWLFLRGRMIPGPLAGLGVAGSVLLVVGLPLQIVGVLQGPVTQLMWLPAAVFEIALALWLLIKGVVNPSS